MGIKLDQFLAIKSGWVINLDGSLDESGIQSAWHVMDVVEGLNPQDFKLIIESAEHGQATINYKTADRITVLHAFAMTFDQAKELGYIPEPSKEKSKADKSKKKSKKDEIKEVVEDVFNDDASQINDEVSG